MVEQANHKDTKENALPDVECGFAGHFVAAFIQ